MSYAMTGSCVLKARQRDPTIRDSELDRTCRIGGDQSTTRIWRRVSVYTCDAQS